MVKKSFAQASVDTLATAEQTGFPTVTHAHRKDTINLTTLVTNGGVMFLAFDWR
jgi:hypothetical protein